MLVQLNEKIIIAFIILFCLHEINCDLQIGDACNVARSGAPGTCRSINNCQIVLDELTQQGLPPFRCGFQNRREVVCCPNPVTKPTTTTQSPEVAQRISSKSMNKLLFC